MLENPSPRSVKNILYVLLGANLGDRQATFRQAKKQISVAVGEIVAESSLYETAAWGLENQPSFLNQVVRIETILNPGEVLAATQQIETALGRVRHEQWGARTIDLDILYYNDIMLESSSLRIPHPRLHLRRFTLVPLTEIAPAFIHPEFQETNEMLLSICPDDGDVTKLS